MKTRIIRSARRRKTVQAREVDGVLEVLAPAGMPDKALAPIIEDLKKRIDRKKKAAALDDAVLERLAENFNRKYFGGRLKWRSIHWAANQNKRHGSCTPGSGAIRISHRLAAMPRFVLDYVIVHELVHLKVPNHGPLFRALVKAHLSPTSDGGRHHD